MFVEKVLKVNKCISYFSVPIEAGSNRGTLVRMCNDTIR